ncbi:MAG TPA: VWA domain-containing protein [Pyrinomonadaceae bacterium]|nr:VWA domain-containing protein [Pyrinomonadaceae bacterium]
MKRIIALTLLCSFAAALVQAQTRPRRVGPTPSSQQQAPQTQSQSQPDDASQTARPSRPPVLGGANRDPNEQKPASTTSSKDAGPEEVGEGDVVRVETTLVSIPVSVTDRDGKYIPNLTKDDFHIWEDGVEQKVAYFASTEKPFTVALVIDTSGSTRFKLEEIQDAAIAFVNQLRSDDRVMVVSFDDKIRVLSQPTNDRATLRNAILQTRIGSGTRLYDAMDQVINQYFNHIEGRKAVVLFTDGVDTASKNARYEDNIRDAEELDALIYPVEYDTSSDMGGGGWPGGGGSRRGGGGGSSGGNSGGGILDILGAILGGGSSNSPQGGGGNYPGGGGRRRGGRGGNWPGGGGSGNGQGEYQIADQYLHDLARVSGARLYNAEQQNLDVAFRSVAEELRRQYSLGYYPKNAPHPGERRNIKVRVNRPELAVRTRDSYVFQPGANATAQSGNTQSGRPPVLKKDFSGGR